VYQLENSNSITLSLEVCEKSTTKAVQKHRYPTPKKRKILESPLYSTDDIDIDDPLVKMTAKRNNQQLEKNLFSDDEYEDDMDYNDNDSSNNINNINSSSYNNGEESEDYNCIFDDDDDDVEDDHESIDLRMWTINDGDVRLAQSKVLQATCVLRPECTGGWNICLDPNCSFTTTTAIKVTEIKMHSNNFPTTGASSTTITSSSASASL